MHAQRHAGGDGEAHHRPVGFDVFKITARTCRPTATSRSSCWRPPGRRSVPPSTSATSPPTSTATAATRSGLIVDEAFSSTLVNGQRVRVDLNRVGIWFADPADDDFCLGPGSRPVTPFDGDNEAGVQAFNSANAARCPPRSHPVPAFTAPGCAPVPGAVLAASQMKRRITGTSHFVAGWITTRAKKVGSLALLVKTCGSVIRLMQHSLVVGRRAVPLYWEAYTTAKLKGAQRVLERAFVTQFCGHMLTGLAREPLLVSA